MNPLSLVRRAGRLASISAQRRLSVETLEARDVPAAYDLGAAVDFNAFFFHHMNAFTSDAEGRVAVGDHATLTSYGIGDKLPNSDGTRDDLIVGGDLDYTYGQVFNGNVVHGGAGNLNSVGIPNGEERQEADVVDFAGAQADLAGKSALWGAEAPNGTTKFKYGNLNLRGTNAQLDIFTITPVQLTHARSINLIVPTNATVLINVPGSSASVQNLGFNLRGSDSAHILWNFFEATDLNVSGVGLPGSVLAPAAALAFNNGQISGTVIADSMSGNGQFNLSPSQIRIEIPKFAELSGAVFLDDSHNNVRDPGEAGFEGADVYLTGTDSLGRNINRYFLSTTDGVFDFGHLWPGTYAVKVVPSQKYADSLENGIIGTVGGATVGTSAVNRVFHISLAAGDDGIDYLLPLVPPQQ